MFVYLVTNQINGKQYVGQTIGSVAQRWAQHCCEARRRGGSIIGAAIRKYGTGNFSIVTIAKAETLDELNELERQCISRYHALVPTGYNLDQGGKNGGSRNPSTRAKLSIARRGKPGTPHTEDFKLRLAISNIGNKYGSKPKSEEHKRKIAEGHRGRPLSDEHKAKISASLKRYYLSKEAHGD